MQLPHAQKVWCHLFLIPHAITSQLEAEVHHDHKTWGSLEV